MQNLKIGFSVSTKYKLPVLSWLIRLFEGWFHSSHAFFEIPVNSEVGMGNYILEASIVEGVHLRLAVDFYKEVEVKRMYEIESTEEQEHAVMDWGRKFVGTPYGIKQLFGDAIHKLLRPFGMHNNPFSDGTETMVCTETVSRVLKDILNLDIPVDFDVIGLQDMQDILEKQLDEGTPIKVARIK